VTQRTALAALLFVACSPAWEVPEVDTCGMEPRVAAHIREAHAAVENHPDDAGAWGLLAQLLDAHGEFESAFLIYARAHALDVGEFRWAYGLAFVGHELRRPLEELEELFATAAKSKGGHAPLYCRWGDARMNGGRFEEAELAYREALECDADLAAAQRGLGHVLSASGRAGEAVRHFQQAVARTPQDAAAWAGLARAYGKLGDGAQARRAAARADAGQALESMPDSYRDEVALFSISSASLLGRAEVALSLGNYQASAEHLEAVAETRPDDPWVWRNLALVLRRAGRAEEARRAVSRAIDLAPDFAFAHLELGKLDETAQRLGEAERSYRKVVALQPQGEEGWARLAATLFQGKRTQEALDLYREADRRIALGAGTLADWGAVCLEAGDVDGAIHHYERALKLDPQHPRAKQGLTRARAMR
jgi:tetratricopeptide (TPR) repeat protein